MLKNDPSFIYTSLKICDKCYECVKSLIAQTDRNQDLIAINKEGLTGMHVSSKQKKLQEGEDNGAEEVTDMLSVEVRVDSAGARMTTSRLTARSDESGNPEEAEQQFISPHSVKAMNLQAQIAAERSSNQPPEGNLEIFAPHERQSAATPPSETQISSSNKSDKSGKDKAGIEMLFQKVEAGKEVPKG